MVVVLVVLLVLVIVTDIYSSYKAQPLALRSNESTID